MGPILVCEPDPPSMCLVLWGRECRVAVLQLPGPYCAPHAPARAMPQIECLAERWELQSPFKYAQIVTPVLRGGKVWLRAPRCAHICMPYGMHMRGELMLSHAPMAIQSTADVYNGA